MKVSNNVLIVAAIVIVAFVLFGPKLRKEGFRQNISKNDYPLGISTVHITPYNTIVRMPYDLPPTLSTDSCIGACSQRQSGPNVLLGQGVFSKGYPPGGSSTDCTMACST